MKDLLKSASALRAEASRDRKDQEFDDALESIQASADILKGLWEQRREAILDAGDGASPDDKELVKELAETYGVMGGIHRSREEYEKAIDAYDEGEYFEQHPARKSDNSYNLMQRLLNRALLAPAGADSPGWNVRGINMKEALEQAQSILATQRSTTRMGDAWAAADQAMTHTLLAALDDDKSKHYEAIDHAWDALDEKTPPFVFDSTLRAMRDAQREFRKSSRDQKGTMTITEILGRSIDRLDLSFAKARKRQSMG